MMAFDQKPNDRRRLEGIVRRLKKERALLDKMQEKYPTYSDDNLEDYAMRTLCKLEDTPSEFISYKTANKAHRHDRSRTL